MKKTYIQTDERFADDVKTLKELNPGFSGSMLIRLAVNKAAKEKMELAFGSIPNNTIAGVEKRKKAMPKEDWCEMFGGELKDGVCTIDKYETMATGHVRKSKRVVAVAAFPVDREEFRQSVLGHFETVEEAEEAYQAKPLH